MISRKISILILVLCSLVVMSMIFVYSYSEENDETIALAEEPTAVLYKKSIPEPEETTEEVDPYADSNVRFGETRNILLLDIEWHTYDSYKEEVVDAYESRMQEYLNSENFTKLSKQQQTDAQKNYETILKDFNRNLNRISSKKVYAVRNINGKSFVNQNGSFTLSLQSWEKISDFLDSDGYYIYEVYPYYPLVTYNDENGDFQFKYFGSYGNDYVNSKKEYDYVLENNIIPLCDELLEKGLITQDSYDAFTIKDPLDKYIDMYFNFKYIVNIN